MINKITELCTGCFACQASCPKQAITAQRDEFGFWIPKIDNKKCIECGKCIRTCPQNSNVSMKLPERVFAAIAKDNAIVSICSSGGAFGIIAENTISDMGYVVGCSNLSGTYSEVMVSDLDSLNQLFGSKYVQSLTEGLILKIKNLLKNGDKVTVCGTPCQIAGIRAALGERENLLLVDLICHGVASPTLLEKYVETYQNRNRCKITGIHFRSKEKTGWGTFCAAIETNKGTRFAKASADPYYYCFLKSYSYSETCYSCKYSRPERVSDITIGDAWGCRDYCSTQFNNQTQGGASLIIVNTEKGERLWNSIQERFVFEQVDYEDASKYNKNLNEPSMRPIKCFYDYDIQDGEYYYKKMAKLIPAKERVKSLIPMVIEERIKTLRKLGLR